MVTRQLVLTVSDADFRDLVSLATSGGETAEYVAAEFINSVLYERHGDFSRFNEGQRAVAMRQEMLADRRKEESKRQSFSLRSEGAD